MSLALGLYRLATGLMEPAAPLLLRQRARRGKEDPARLGERLGRPSRQRPEGPLAWLHGASVGESLSLLPVIARLRRDRPDLNLLVTSGTTTSAELLGRRLPAEAVHQYAPVDAPRSAGRFLNHWRPDLVVLVESELWPTLVTGARRRGARLALLSARMGAQSARGWARSPAAALQVFGAFDLILPQDDAAAARLRGLGARDDGRLNLKFVGDPLPFDPAELDRLRTEIGARPMLLAASTHPGEEAVILDAFAALGPGAEAWLMLVPRHPARGPELVALARERGFQVRQRARGEGPDGARVYVADTLGELGLWFRLARHALIGGSLVDGVGGHNPLEPVRLSCPAASGPYVENWREAYDRLAEVGEIEIVGDAAALAQTWRGVLDGAPRRAAAGPGMLAREAEAFEAAMARLVGLAS